MTTAGPDAEPAAGGPLPAAVAQILDAAGVVAGAGFLIDADVLVTCAHVVSAAGSGPGGRLRLAFPHAPGARDWFPDPVAKEVVAFRNGTLQAGYLILAARALGFDCGPMSGFDNAGVDKEFFAGTAIKSNFIVAIGKGTDENLYPRNPRLSFEDANTII